MSEIRHRIAVDVAADALLDSYDHVPVTPEFQGKGRVFIQRLGGQDDAMHRQHKRIADKLHREFARGRTHLRKTEWQDVARQTLAIPDDLYLARRAEHRARGVYIDYTYAIADTLYVDRNDLWLHMFQTDALVNKKGIRVSSWRPIVVSLHCMGRRFQRAERLEHVEHEALKDEMVRLTEASNAMITTVPEMSGNDSVFLRLPTGGAYWGFWRADTQYNTPMLIARTFFDNDNKILRRGKLIGTNNGVVCGVIKDGEDISQDVAK